MDELQEMQAQMALLKQKLNNEEIINDRLLREVTRQRVQRLSRMVWIEGICALFVVTFGNYIFYGFGCSWWFIGGTTLMMLVCFLATLLPHRRVKEREIMQGDLLTVSKRVRQLRQFYKNWIRIGFSMVAIWLIWFFTELYLHHTDDLTFVISIAVGAIVGGAIGGIIGSLQNKKCIREMDEIIGQIEH